MSSFNHPYVIIIYIFLSMDQKIRCSYTTKIQYVYLSLTNNISLWKYRQTANVWRYFRSWRQNNIVVTKWHVVAFTTSSSTFFPWDRIYIYGGKMSFLPSNIDFLFNLCRGNQITLLIFMSRNTGQSYNHVFFTSMQKKNYI